MSQFKNKLATCANPLALVLWVIVGTALVFGVTRTAITAAALFTG